MTASSSQTYWRTLSGQRIPASLRPFSVFFEYLPPHSRLLDVGCGAGKTIAWLREQGYHNIIGVDLNAQAVRPSRPGKARWSPAFLAANAAFLPFRAETFDGVITQAFWTTIVDPAERLPIVCEIARVLRPAGVLYLADFGINWDLPRYRARYEDGLRKGYERGTFDVTDDVTNDVADGEGRAVLYQAHHYTAGELENLLRAGGFHIVSHTQPDVPTRSGNIISGHIIIARRLPC